MTELKLNSNDYMAITRAMDLNKNNRVDPTEASISYNAHTKIGNSNGIAGTRELANALQNGDVYVTRLAAETADRIAHYFSKHEANLNRPVAEWISDAFISREDLSLDEGTRRALDRNNDNRISREEFAFALTAGTLQIGTSRTVSQNPFTQPSYPHGTDPFKPQPSNPYGTDPFTQPSNPYGTDPFQPTHPYEQDTDASLKLQMLKGLSYDSDKVKILTEVARQPYLSTREQQLVVDYAANLSYDSNQQQVLKALAQNSHLSDTGAAYLAQKVDSMMDYDSNKTEVLNHLINNQRLGSHAQVAVIDSTLGMSYESNQVSVLKNLIGNQDLDQSTKQYLLTKVQNNFDYDSNKRAIYEALFNR